MNLLHLLGTLALGVGGSLLLSTFLIGQDLLSELTGSPLGSLYGGCFIAIALGAVAVRLGRQEERENRYDEEGGKK